MSSLHGVIVVDDEMLIRQGIINYIEWEKEGFQIIGEASNGKEALKLIEQLRPRILITDIVMPGMDGIELVRIVKEQYPEIEIIVLSSFENFDYVRSTFQNGVADYILKPKLNGRELIKALRKVVPPSASPEKEKESVSVEELLKRRISGYSLAGAEKIFQEKFSHSQFSLIAVYGLQNKDSYSAFEEISSQLITEISGAAVFFIPLFENGNIKMLINFPLEKREVMEQALIQLAEQEDTYGKNTNWLMSRPFSSIDELKEIYENNLMKMRDYLFYLTEERILIYRSLPEIAKIDKPFDLSQFIDLFKQEKFEFAIASLKEHVDLLTRDYTKDIFEFKSWLENIIFNITVLLGNMKYDTEELEAAKYEYFTIINEADNADEAIACFHDFLEAVRRIIPVTDDENHPPNMRRLLQYIENHYAEPLSLTTLADHFNFNASYLSSYFSTHLQIGFSDYLNQVRIAKARHILKSSSAPISLVSEMVGYSEPSYFCKVFKRLEGSSPGSYRKTNSNSESRAGNEASSADYSKQ